ncbi:hypothetical protein [Sphingomonas sp.]|uniref:hypothetical protein n=1 Tax=Sphingomonas sp. TaxID=28214 RepID=UPI0035BC8954
MTTPSPTLPSPTPSIPRIDARETAHRDIAKYLREQHLPGVDTDDDASVTLEIEQARLMLLASGGVIAFEVTQLLSSTRYVCVTPLYWSLSLMCLAMCGAWIALVWSEQIRRFRVNRRYTIYHGELREYLSLNDSDAVNHYRTDAEWSGQLILEGGKRRSLRNFRNIVAILAAAGIGAGVISTIGTADPRRCHFELLKPQAK